MWSAWKPVIGEVERVEELDVRAVLAVPVEVRAGHEVIDPLVVVLDALHPDEHHAEDDRREEAADEHAPLAALRAPDRQRHRERARDQHDRVERAEADVQVVAAVVERVRVREAVDRVA
jgi:hypothetical protein